MRKNFIIALWIGIAVTVASCTKENQTASLTKHPASSGAHLASRMYGADSTDTINSTFITITTANTMISSYLTSINASINDSDVHSFSVNADSLRAYLANSQIKNVKLIFAHTASYMNAGYTGQYAGYQSGAITIIIAAYDASGNYVYYNDKYVLDHVAPCPYTCPPGAAGNNLLY